ncbi:MAG: SRPBCC domain-containing protein [Gammaproteobacteria bacterium]|nr:SRPBCC domain-containing protein [Gammaproteobacteria bacterium]
MRDSTSENHVLRTERRFSSSPEEIFAAFSQPETLARWWGPNGFTSTFSTFEFEEGGSWEFVMHGPDGHDYPNSSVLIKLEAGKLIEIQHVSAPRFKLSITLSPVAGGTLVQWIQAFEEPKVVEAIRHIAEPGNEQNLDRLQSLLQGDPNT